MTIDLTTLSDAELSVLFTDLFDRAYVIGHDERWVKGTQAYSDRSSWLAVVEEQNNRAPRQTTASKAVLVAFENGWLPACADVGILELSIDPTFLNAGVFDANGDFAK